jgi:hypothetical protein
MLPDFVALTFLNALNSQWSFSSSLTLLEYSVMLSIHNGRIPFLAELGWGDYAPSLRNGRSRRRFHSLKTPLLIGLPFCLYPPLAAAELRPLAHWADSSLYPAKRALTTALIGLPYCLHPAQRAAIFCPHWADSSLHPAQRALTSALIPAGRALPGLTRRYCSFSVEIRLSRGLGIRGEWDCRRC